MIDLLKPLAPLKFNRYSTIKNDKKLYFLYQRSFFCIRGQNIQKNAIPLNDVMFILAGVPGFEPGKCQIQSLVPYRLAIPQCA